MNSFLKNLFIFSLPFLICIPVEISVRNNTFKAKSEHLYKHQDSIELMVLGSSQNWRAINPEFLSQKTAQLAHPSSATNIDYLLFEKFFSQLPNLKCVIFELSYQSLESICTNTWPNNHLLLHYYGINNYGRKPPLTEHFLISANPKEYLKRYFTKQTKQKFGSYNEFGFIYAYPQSRFKEHNFDKEEIKESSMTEYLKGRHQSESIENLNRNRRYLDSAISRCLENNVKVILLSPPKYYLYNEYMNQDKLKRRNQFLDTYRKVPNVYIMNYELEYESEVEMFLNEDHLNPLGAELFTKELNYRISQIESD